jgi:hypothetical protein
MNNNQFTFWHQENPISLGLKLDVCIRGLIETMRGGETFQPKLIQFSFRTGAFQYLLLRVDDK